MRVLRWIVIAAVGGGGSAVSAQPPRPARAMGRRTRPRSAKKKVARSTPPKFHNGGVSQVHGELREGSQVVLVIEIELMAQLLQKWCASVDSHEWII